jgi:hypothetical protein
VTKRELLALIEAQRERIDALERRLAEVEARPIVQGITITEAPAQPWWPNPDQPWKNVPWASPMVWCGKTDGSVTATFDGGVSCDEPTARLLNWLERRAE